MSSFVGSAVDRVVLSSDERPPPFPVTTPPSKAVPREFLSGTTLGFPFTPAMFEACARVQPPPRGELELQDAVMIAMRDLE
jgi:hypothetical protein